MSKTYTAIELAQEFLDEGGTDQFYGEAIKELIAIAQAMKMGSSLGLPIRGERFTIQHDGFHGEVIGYYQRRDGKRGVVGQQIGTNIVHVYGEKWLQP